MKVVRVLFGINSSPLLLNAVLRHHLNLNDPTSRAVVELKDQLFIDDWLGGADTEEEAWSLFPEAHQILLQAGIPLVNYVSHSALVFDRAQAKSVALADTELLRVLGMRWSCDSGAFLFDGIPVSENIVVTKRVVLSFTARF